MKNNTFQKNNSFPNNQLLQYDNQLVRVLDSTTDSVFIIDCIKRTMPVWKDIESIKEYVPCSECQTAHCGRGKSHFIFGGLASPIVPYRNLKQTTDGITADCRSLV